VPHWERRESQAIPLELACPNREYHRSQEVRNTTGHRGPARASPGALPPRSSRSRRPAAQARDAAWRRARKRASIWIVAGAPGRGGGEPRPRRAGSAGALEGESADRNRTRSRSERHLRPAPVVRSPCRRDRKRTKREPHFCPRRESYLRSSTDRIAFLPNNAQRELDADRMLVLMHHGGRGKTSGLEVGQFNSDGANVFHIRTQASYSRRLSLAINGRNRAASSRLIGLPRSIRSSSASRTAKRRSPRPRAASSSLAGLHGHGPIANICSYSGQGRARLRDSGQAAA
jgi:hypothetical protein